MSQYKDWSWNALLKEICKNVTNNKEEHTAHMYNTTYRIDSFSNKNSFWQDYQFQEAEFSIHNPNKIG